MTATPYKTPDELTRPLVPHNPSSVVAWGAIAAGATAAAVLSLLMLVLGTGLGLSSVSPWAANNPSPKAFGVSTILWLSLTQIVASSIGGYLAGRLRNRWVDARSDEVFFRDTAHGFLAWAVATLTVATLFTSAASAIVSGGIQTGVSLSGNARMAPVGVAAATSGMAVPEGYENKLSYFVDYLLRGNAAAPSPVSSYGSAPPAAQNPTSAANAGGTAASVQASEIRQILLNSLGRGGLPADDLHYLGQVVAQRGGLTTQEAEKRVSEVFVRAQASLQEAEALVRDTAEKVRKASAYTALWLFISLLIGAFVASLTATYGGRLRDD